MSQSSAHSNVDDEWCSNDELTDEEYEIDESSLDDDHPSSTSGPRIKKHVNKGRWTKDEDEKLKVLVEQHGEKWEAIAGCFLDRNDVQCQQRWQKVVNPELVKGPWTKEVSVCALVLVTSCSQAGYFPLPHCGHLLQPSVQLHWSAGPCIVLSPYLLPQHNTLVSPGTKLLLLLPSLLHHSVVN
nr:transcriptional activator Myb-like [Cherax quadricarinatus]